MVSASLARLAYLRWFAEPEKRTGRIDETLRKPTNRRFCHYAGCPDLTGPHGIRCLHRRLQSNLFLPASGFPISPSRSTADRSDPVCLNPGCRGGFAGRIVGGHDAVGWSGTLMGATKHQGLCGLPPRYRPLPGRRAGQRNIILINQRPVPGHTPD